MPEGTINVPLVANVVIRPVPNVPEIGLILGEVKFDKLLI
jgi:hypothetical protein